MDGTLDRFGDDAVATVEQTPVNDADRLRDENAELGQLIVVLEQTVGQLHDELGRFETENAELRQQCGYWKAMHARAVEREKTLAEEIERLEGEIRKLKDERFGKKSEKQTSTDRSNTLGEDTSKPKRRRGQQRNNPAPKRRDYSHLPKRQKIITLPEEECRCQHCGMPFAEMSDEEVAEQIEIEVSAFRQELIRKRYRRTCKCSNCPWTVTAPLPPKLLPKARLGTSVWIEILLDKYKHHCPTGRLIDRLRLIGLDLAPGTIADGLKKIEPMFTAIYEALCRRNGQSGLHQADETRWMVFIDHEGKSGHRWWLWMFSAEDTILFVLDPSRSHEVPEQHYPPDIDGVLLVDRYSAYKAMAQVKSGSLLLAFCWAHVRRDFIKVGKGWEELESWAIDWLLRIRVLYALGRRRLSPKTDSDEFAAADAELRAQIERMRRQMEDELAQPTLREPVRKTLESLREHWQGLTRFLADPRIPMDNNKSERIVRGPAIGRKNYYGSASAWSGRLAMNLFSIFATLSLWNINPRAWLTWYLQQCAESGGRAPDDIEPYLPWNLSPEQISALNAPASPSIFDTS